MCRGKRPEYLTYLRRPKMRREVDAVVWTIRYQLSGEAGVRVVSTLPLAVKEALRLIDQGAHVSQIEGSGGLKGMNADEILAVYAERKAKKPK